MACKGKGDLRKQDAETKKGLQARNARAGGIWERENEGPKWQRTCGLSRSGRSAITNRVGTMPAVPAAEARFFSAPQWTERA